MTGPMTMELYTKLDETETRFDGHIAQKHLQGRLAMQVRPLSEGAGRERELGDWAGKNAGAISVHPIGPHIIEA